jgi:hypothetical protein
MLKALLWKEWQEQRWRVALATVWLLGMTAIGLKTRILSDDNILAMVWAPAVIVLPVFLGMGLFSAERKDGTLRHLLVQPVRRAQILIAKVIAGLLTCVTPFLIGGIVVCLAVGGREVSFAYMATGFAVLTLLAVILFAWQLLAGLRCRRQETYVLVSGIVLGCWAIHAVIVEEWNLTNRLGYWAWALSPFAVGGVDLGDPREVWTVIVLQSLILAGLGFGLWLRFHRLREGKS